MAENTPSLHEQLEQRMNFMQINGARRERIAQIRDILDRELPVGLDKFYEQVKVTPETMKFFSSLGHIDKAKSAQVQHWKSIASGNFDERYMANVRRIGLTHARIGLEPQWYIGGYAMILEHLVHAIVQELWPKSRLRRSNAAEAELVSEALGSLIKAVLLDMDISISVYLEAAEEARIKAAAEARSKERALVSSSFGQALASLAEQDLTHRMAHDLPEDYRELQDNFNAAIAQFETAMADVATGAQAISHEAGDIAMSADDLSRRTEEQSSNVVETAAAVYEITTTVKVTADAAQEGHRLVSTTMADAEKSGEVVKRAIEAMNRIERSSNNIGQIIGAIDEIAFQTNLLALNAGVEAARAGDAGRGFAVVASEVRALAQRASESAKEIKGLISTSSSEVEAGVSLVVEAGRTLEKIAAQVMEINTVVSSIANSAQEQSTALQQVNEAVANVEQDTQKNALMVSETTAASQKLQREAQELALSVGRFKTNAVATPTRRHAAPMPSAHSEMQKSIAAGGRNARAMLQMSASPEARSNDWSEF